MKLLVLFAVYGMTIIHGYLHEYYIISGPNTLLVGHQMYYDTVWSGYCAKTNETTSEKEHIVNHTCTLRKDLKPVVKP
jgi:hypothetical protein